MGKLSLLLGVFVVVAAATVALAGDITISTNTLWSGTVTIDGTVTVNSTAAITVQPGTIINFVGAGNIKFSRGGLFSAQGTAAAPIQFVGTQTGNITGNLTGMTLSNCVVTGMGTVTGTTHNSWMYVNPGASGFSMNSCTVSNSGPMSTMNSANSGPQSITNCDLNSTGSWALMSTVGSAITFASNKAQGISFRAYTNNTSDISHNVIINGTLWADGGAAPANIAVHDNYIHDPNPNSYPSGQYGIESTNGQVYNNIIRGTNWGMSPIGGHVYNNVLEAGDGIHEQSGDLMDGAVFERNIIVGASMGACMTGASYLGSNVVFRNNTIDMRGVAGTTSSACIYLNHLPTSRATGMNIRNNLFLRTGRITDGKPYADTIGYVDYNCWAGQATDGYPGTSTRFSQISITGKVEGDDGFGMHDTILPTLAQGYNPASLVQNASFVDPYSDADMLAGTYTCAQLLDSYRQAYTPVAGSALINAGSPTDASDPAVTYGQVDIGAVEVALLPGDTDMDRKVTFADYIVLERNFGASNATWAMGDFNGDGRVTFADYVILEGGFGKSVPEPMTLLVLVVSMLAGPKRKL